MNSYSRSHLSDSTLLSELHTHLFHERGATAELLADIGEVDARRLYAPAGYQSMFAYCVEELHLSEDAAYKRIQVGRAARAFPAIFVAVAEGRLHLSGAILLVPHLTDENAESLLQVASNQSKRAIEQLIAERFPRTESLGLVQPIPSSPHRCVAEIVQHQLAPGQVEAVVTPAVADPQSARVTAIAPQRYAYQFNVAQSGHEKFEYLRALLGHKVPSGNRDEVFETRAGSGHSGAGETQVRGDVQASSQLSPSQQEPAPYPSSGPKSGVGPGRRPMQLRWREWPSLRRPQSA